MKKKMLIVVTAVVLLAAGGAGAWYYLGGHAKGGHEAEKPPVDHRVYKYVTLDKIIVMLRNGSEGEIQGPSHYLAVDLVFKTPQETEKIAKEHLPMLRSVAVKALSTYTRDAAVGMTIDQFSAAINRAYSESYANDQQEKPFTDVLISKLIIE